MSCNYADGLSPYQNKGILGIDEKFDSAANIRNKVSILADWILSAKHVVFHTGAGISTSAGIPDFRGPKGVWTLEKKGLKPDMNISFNDAVPTKTHMALAKLVEVGKVKYIVSQNIDGLHLRSGVPRSHLAELHGNMFIEQCSQCNRQFVRNSATSSVGQKCLQKPCPTSKPNGRPCRGRMHDVVLDWEHNLPERDLGLADFHSCVADLSICLGTTMQIVPSGNLPLHTKKYSSGRLVICNLQPTKHDRKADLLIHSYVDEVMSQLMEKLSFTIPEYTRDKDPILSSSDSRLVEWTILQSDVHKMRVMYESKCCKGKNKRTVKEEFTTDGKKIKKEEDEQIKFENKNTCGNIKTEEVTVIPSVIKDIKTEIASNNGITEISVIKQTELIEIETVT